MTRLTEITQADERGGEVLADILEDERLPKEVRDLFNDAVLEMVNRADVTMTTPEILRLALPLAIGRLRQSRSPKN